MKRILIFGVIVLLLFSFILTGCPENGGTATALLTEDEVLIIAEASLGFSMLPMMFTMEGLADGTYGAGELDGMVVSGTFTVADEGTTFTFINCGMGIDSVAGIDITLNGGFSVGGDLETIIFTFNAFSINGTLPSTGATIDSIVTGTSTMTETELSVDITISGIADDPCAVVIVMPMGVEGPAEVTSATINGVDYTAEFTLALTEFFGGEE